MNASSFEPTLTTDSFTTYPYAYTYKSTAYIRLREHNPTIGMLKRWNLVPTKLCAGPKLMFQVNLARFFSTTISQYDLINFFLNFITKSHLQDGNEFD